jgi:hypothetical protein
MPIGVVDANPFDASVGEVGGSADWVDLRKAVVDRGEECLAKPVMERAGVADDCSDCVGAVHLVLPAGVIYIAQQARNASEPMKKPGKVQWLDVRARDGI